MRRTGNPGGSGDQPDLDRKAVMARFGAPTRGQPRRPGAMAAHLIDRPTALPNRIALMAEIDFALTSTAEHVGLVLVQLSGQPADSPGAPNGSAGLVAAAARLRTAVRPTDLVARTGIDELGAALWGLASPDLVAVVLQRVRRAFAEPIMVPGRSSPLGVTIGIGTSAPGATAGAALAGARAIVDRSRPLWYPG